MLTSCVDASSCVTQRRASDAILPMSGWRANDDQLEGDTARNTCFSRRSTPFRRFTLSRGALVTSRHHMNPNLFADDLCVKQTRAWQAIRRSVLASLSFRSEQTVAGPSTRASRLARDDMCRGSLGMTSAIQGGPVSPAPGSSGSRSSFGGLPKLQFALSTNPRSARRRSDT